METLQQQRVCWVLFSKGMGKEIVLFTRMIRLSYREFADGTHLDGFKVGFKTYKWQF